jgi:sigma-E factor negative regulatory protein RseA
MKKQTDMSNLPNIPTDSLTCELLSALADGELAGAEFAVALKACHRDGDAAFANWSSYHLIGDVLRSPASGLRAADAQFLARFNRRLEGQAHDQGAKAYSAGLEPVAQKIQPAMVSGPDRRTASNDGSFRWKLVAGFASLAAVASVAWNISGVSSPASTPQLAQAQVPLQQVLVASPQGPVLRDARLEELLAAHRQLGGRYALQEPSGFLRNATFEASRDGRR